MNKKVIIISIVVILFIIMAVIIINIFKDKNGNNDLNVSSNIINNVENLNGSLENIVDDNGTIEEITEVNFGNHGASYWEKLIKEFYQKNCDSVPDSVICYVDIDGRFAADIYFENNNEEYYYYFDSNTYYLIFDDGREADLENCTWHENNVYSGVNFSDNQCLAIGYVTSQDENLFANKYFGSLNYYEGLDLYDFRTEDSKEKNYGNKFVIVPKSDLVNVSVYNCFVNEAGEMELDNTLIGNRNTSFIVMDDYIEYTPTMAIVFEYNGFQDTVYINFSGENGHLSLEGHEEEVKDITIYND